MEGPSPTFSTIDQPSSNTCKTRTLSPGDTSNSSSRVGTNGRQIVSMWERTGGSTESSNGLTAGTGSSGIAMAKMVPRLHAAGEANSGLKIGGGEWSWTSVVVDEAGELIAWRGDIAGGDIGIGGLGNENVSEGEKGRTDMGDIPPASTSSYSVETSRYCALASLPVMLIKDSLCAAWPPVAIKTELRSRTSAMGGSSGAPS